MNDKELLELAAKAAGSTDTRERIGSGILVQWEEGLRGYVAWNPLTDDGDALRLAVKLNIRFIGMWAGDAIACAGIVEHRISDNDPYAATRRAIVRAAAEIGSHMP